MRTLLAYISIIVLAVLTLNAQQAYEMGSGEKSSSKKLPNGWMMRLDRPSANPQNISFTSDDKGYHITAGPAAIYYHQNNMAEGTFRAEATFTQLKETGHPEAYGIFVGGQNLQKDNQQYLYFLVRQDGKYLIKKREGKGTSTITDWTKHEAVKKIGENGKVKNKLSMKISGNEVQFLVNGEMVKSHPKENLISTNGQVGLRVNHRLDVRVSDFKVEPLS